MGLYGAKPYWEIMELRFIWSYALPGDHGARLYMELGIPGDHGARLYMELGPTGRSWS